MLYGAAAFRADFAIAMTSQFRSWALLEEITNLFSGRSMNSVINRAELAGAQNVIWKNLVTSKNVLQRREDVFPVGNHPNGHQSQFDFQRPFFRQSCSGFFAGVNHNIVRSQLEDVGKREVGSGVEAEEFIQRDFVDDRRVCVGLDDDDLFRVEFPVMTDRARVLAGEEGQPAFFNCLQNISGSCVTNALMDTSHFYLGVRVRHCKI